MKPIDEKLANKAEIQVNDRPKEEKQAYDKGFVTGVLSIALEFELDKEEVASFLEDRRVLTKAIELLENERPKGKWLLHGMIYYCSECGHDCEQGGNNYCGNCGADMREANND